jgi:hypothetical protein
MSIKKNHENYENLSNRDKKFIARGRPYWCGKCDRDLVFGNTKCGTCNCRDGRRRFKHRDKR